MTAEKTVELYQVVYNHEEQYSIWLQGKELPKRWTATDKIGTKDECLAYIKEVWTDMRPLSLRNKNISVQKKGGK